MCNVDHWTATVDQLKRCTIDTKTYLTVDGKFKCRYQHCDKDFKYGGVSRENHELTHDGFIYQKPPSCNTFTFGMTDEDGDCFNYQISLLEFGMVLRNFHDAISEADGDRILRQWKYMLLYFRADGSASTKYALESLYMLLQYYALLSPRDAERLIWNRSVKAKHGKGRNIPLDMHWSTTMT